MPRYSGVLASLFLIVLCVGFNIKRYPVVSEMLQNGPCETANAAMKVSETKPSTNTGETYHSYTLPNNSSSNSMGKARQPIPSSSATGTTVSDQIGDIRSGDRRSDTSCSSASSSDIKSQPPYVPNIGMKTSYPESTASFANDPLFGNFGNDADNSFRAADMTPGHRTSSPDNVSSGEMTDENREENVSERVNDSHHADETATTGENTTTSTMPSTPMTSAPMPQTIPKPGSYQTDDALPGYAGEYRSPGQPVMTPPAMAVPSPSENKENALSTQEKFGIKKETPFMLRNETTTSKTSQRGSSEYVPPKMLPVTEDHDTHGFMMPTAETGTVLTLVMPIPETQKHEE